MKHRLAGKTLVRFLLILALSLMVIADASAKLPMPEMREWTSAAGSRITASLVGTRGDSVVLKTEEGKTMTVELAQLSAADQEYVKSIVAAVAAAEKDAAASTGEGGTDVTEEWYKEGNRTNLEQRRVIQNFSLEAGGKRRFQIDDAEGDNYKVYFTVDIGSDLADQYGKQHVIKLEQRGSDDSIASNIGGGMGFTPKGGKLKMEISNDSDKTVRIAVTVDRDKDDAKRE